MRHSYDLWSSRWESASFVELRRPMVTTFVMGGVVCLFKVFLCWIGAVVRIAPIREAALLKQSEP